MSTVDTNHLEALGNSAVNKDLYRKSGVDASLLEKFDSPYLAKGVRGIVSIRAPEFTSLCPITGQPDFATIVLDYQPAKHCIESKSLKLYLGSFRNEGEFHESVCARIAKDLDVLLKPQWLRVKCEFTPRGGIPFWPTVIIGTLHESLAREV